MFVHCTPCFTGWRPFVCLSRRVVQHQVGGQEKFIRVTAMEWLCQFVKLGRNKLIIVLDKILAAVFKCFSDPAVEIVEEAERTNATLLELVAVTKKEFSYGPVLEVRCAPPLSFPTLRFCCCSCCTFDTVHPTPTPILCQAATSTFVQGNNTAQSAALTWIEMLLSKDADKVMEFDRTILNALLTNLADGSEDAVLKANLNVMARISLQNPKFLRNSVLPGLASLLSQRRPLLESRGAFIIRRLCVFIPPQVIYLSLAEILLDWTDTEFVILMVEVLNLLLLTAVELVRVWWHVCAHAFSSLNVVHVWCVWLRGAGVPD